MCGSVPLRQWKKQDVFEKLYYPAVCEFSISYYLPLCSPHIHTHNNKTEFFFPPNLSLQSQSWWNRFFRQFTKVTLEQTPEHGHLALYSNMYKAHKFDSKPFCFTHMPINIILNVQLRTRIVLDGWFIDGFMQLLQSQQCTKPTSISQLLLMTYSLHCQLLIVTKFNSKTHGGTPMRGHSLALPLKPQNLSVFLFLFNPLSVHFMFYVPLWLIYHTQLHFPS